MKAAILVETNKPLEIHNIELESLKEGEVLIKMIAAGVCHSDHHAMVGHFPTRTPIILGHEGAGIIEEVGPNVKSLKKGDHVVSVWRYSCGTCEPCMSGRPATCGEGARMRADGTLSDGTTRFKLKNEKITCDFISYTFNRTPRWAHKISPIIEFSIIVTSHSE